MSTHCTIAMKLQQAKEYLKSTSINGKYLDLNQEDQYIYVYCNFDGYILDGVGETLYNKYNDYKAIENLIMQGDRATLETGKPNESYAIKDLCAGNDNAWKKNMPNVAQERDDIERQSYDYLFEHDRWYIRSFNFGDNEWYTYEDALKLLEQNQ